MYGKGKYLRRREGYAIAAPDAPYKTVTSTTYTAVARAIFLGVAGDQPKKMKAVASIQGSGASGSIRVVNLGTSQVICELTSITNTSPQILDLGTLSNLPTTEALIEVQILVTGNLLDRQIRVAFFQMQW